MLDQGEQFELMDREACKQYGEQVSDAVLHKVRENTAKRRRPEASFRKAKGEPMEIGHVKDDIHHWPHDQALGKGKAQGNDRRQRYMLP